MYLTSEKKAEIFAKHGNDAKNTGGAESQIALFTFRIQHLTEHPDRNRRIAADLIANATHYNLILSDRLDHLRALMDALPDHLRAHAVMIDGSMTSKRGKADREAAIEAMRTEMDAQIQRIMTENES